jgi:hypothetical protein
MFAASALVVAGVVDWAARRGDGVWSWRQLRGRSAWLCAVALILLVVMSVVDPVETGVWPEGDSAQGFSMFTFVESLGIAIVAALCAPSDLGVTQLGWDSLSDGELVQPRLRIALRRFRLLSRASYVDVDRSGATLVIPRVFGRRGRWFIPLDVIGVVVPDHGAAIEKVVLRGTTNGEWVTRTEFHVPYVATTSPLTAPNLVLLFTVPQRVLPIRFFAGRDLDLSWRQTRGQDGVGVDGVALRAVDPEAARLALLGQGARVVADPDAFVEQYREVVRDPAEVRRIVAGKRRSAILLGCFGVAAFAMLIAFKATEDYRYAIGMAATVFLSWVLEWTHRRRTTEG